MLRKARGRLISASQAIVHFLTSLRLCVRVAVLLVVLYVGVWVLCDVIPVECVLWECEVLHLQLLPCKVPCRADLRLRHGRFNKRSRRRPTRRMHHLWPWKIFWGKISLCFLLSVLRMVFDTYPKGLLLSCVVWMSYVFVCTPVLALPRVPREVSAYLHIMLLLMAGDVHPNPGPSSAFLSLNVGGPHLSHHRWAQLSQALRQHSPLVIALQEFRFKTGDWLEAQMAVLLQEYELVASQPLGAHTDVVFFVHQRVHRYVTLSSSCSNRGLAITLRMPEAPMLTLVNIHFPHSVQDKTVVNSWLGSLPHVDALMGDFNAPIWPSQPTNAKWEWQSRLCHGELVDPPSHIYALSDMPSLHTRGMNRLDALLVSPQFLPVFPILAYDVLSLNGAGDHRAVLLYVDTPGRISSEPEASVSIARWNRGDKKQFCKYMQKWADNHPPQGMDVNDRMLQLNTVMRTYLDNQHRLKSRVHTPMDAAQGESGAAQRASKSLRFFRRSAVQGRGYFFRMLRQWLNGPLVSTSPQPSLDSAAAKLPHFAGPTEWYPEKVMSLLREHLPSHVLGPLEPPSYDEFCRSLGKSMRKAMAGDGLPTPLLQCLPPVLKWELYLYMLEVWKTGRVPTAWLQTRVALIYKKGDPECASHYRPIFVNTTLYMSFSLLLFKRVRQVLYGLLGPEQYARPRRSTTEQAANLGLYLERHFKKGTPLYVCKLDVAKAFPSVPHALVLSLLDHLGLSSPLLQAYATSLKYTVCTYSQKGAAPVCYTPHKGLKEGCPLSPLFFNLVYHVALTELHHKCSGVRFFAYMDDLAFVAHSVSELQATWSQVQATLQLFGMRLNQDKTELYDWNDTPGGRSIYWGNTRMEVRGSRFLYLGHWLAPHAQSHLVWDEEYRAVVSTLQRFSSIPLNAWERVQLVNVMLGPRFQYRLLFVPHPAGWHKLDKLFYNFVCQAKGQVLHMFLRKMHMPVRLGGMGLHYQCVKWHARYVTVIQRMLRDPSPDACYVAQHLPNSVILSAYADAVHDFGGETGVTTQQKSTRRTTGGLTLYDSESSSDEVLTTDMLSRRTGLHPQCPIVLPPQHDSEDLEVPTGWVREDIGDYEVLTKGYWLPDQEWFTDGSCVEGRAGFGVCTETFQLCGRVMGPQTPYRGELTGVHAALLLQPLPVRLDNKAVVEHAPHYPHREATDQDLRLKVFDQLQKGASCLSWIQGHQCQRPGQDVSLQAAIRLNSLADSLAKQGTGLPLRPKVPSDLSSIVLSGQEAPTPAKKWVAALCRYPLYEESHWVSFLPLKGQRRGVWLSWLWGMVVWVGTGVPWQRYKRVYCSLCTQTHGPTVHSRLVQCPTWKAQFWDMWYGAWGDVSSVVCAWHSSVGACYDLLIASLHVPRSLGILLQKHCGNQFRLTVARFQYRVLWGVLSLRSTLPMVPHADPETPLTRKRAPWYTPLSGPVPQPNMTLRKLRDQVKLPAPRYGAPRQMELRKVLTKLKCYPPRSPQWWDLLPYVSQLPSRYKLAFYQHASWPYAISFGGGEVPERVLEPLTPFLMPKHLPLVGKWLQQHVQSGEELLRQHKRMLSMQF